MFRKVFSSPSRDLPLNNTLELANEQIENARNASTPEKARWICNDAKTTIKDAGIIFTNRRVGGQTLNEDIADAYHKLGKVQEELGQHSEAQKSFKKATKWGYIEAYHCGYGHVGYQRCVIQSSRYSKRD
ncbi:hypothetical protein BGZ79_001829 [Entomortierella chlamydospora]|nr:hypothetical protein BGZ79_001829 [Entomortierella chlamydospora]